MHISWCSKKYHLVYHLNKYPEVSAKRGLLHMVIPCITPRCDMYIDYVNGPSTVVQGETCVTAHKDPDLSLT